MLKGTIIKSTGSWYQVKPHNSQDILDCRIIGKFRLEELKTTNPIAVGDEVEIVPDIESGKGIIKSILLRKNYIIRQSTHKKLDLHLIASNVDQALIICTIVEPNLKQGFIDRYLLMTEPYEIPAILVFNKCDLYQEEELQMFRYLESVYESIGYKVLLTSVISGQGIEELRANLQDKTTLIGGQSGVGKSSLINAVQPGLDLRTGDLSGYSGKGQHTTTFAEMHFLSSGGAIIDTPGIKSLSFNHLEQLDVAHNFKEFFENSSHCKFGSRCLHRSEPGCAIKAAVEQEKISELRYINYVTLLDEIEQQNYWERNKDV